MKKLILALLPALLLSTTALVPSAKAQEAFPTMEVKMTLKLTPFNLAYLAYHGYFESQGIPQYQGLTDSFQSGKITATQVVKAAVKDNRLPESFLKNEPYIQAVATQLYSLTIGGNR